MRYYVSILPLVFLLASCSLLDLLPLADGDTPTTQIAAPTVTDQTWAEGDSCYSEFVSLPARGIAIGAQAMVVTELAIRDHHTALDDMGMLSSGETITILDGPYCYETRNGGNRWWHVRVDTSGITGYVDEFSRSIGAIYVYLDPIGAGDAGLSLTHFSVSIPSAFGRPANPQETVQVSWLVIGAETVTVYRQDTGEIIGSGAHNVVDFVVPAANAIDFRLVAAASDGTQIEGYRNLSIDCGSCQAGQVAQVDLSYQAFENGMMLYRSDAGLIYVLDFGGRAWTFADTYQGGTLDAGELPPEGRYQPQLGFGHVWLNQAGIRAALGWASSLETYYSSELMIDGAGVQLQLPDGRSIIISDTGWQYR